MIDDGTVAGRVAGARARIAAACARAGRRPSEVRLVAATKTQPAERVAEAIAAGVNAVGENRVQEGAAKRPLVAAAAPWRLIGPLQRNKARRAAEVFDAVETVDRPEVADALERALVESDRVLPVLLEVNVGGEAQKSGVAPDALPALAGHVLESCPHLRLEGLMTVPAYEEDPERSRPSFAALRELAARLAAETGLARLELSMGMSEDFEVAVEEGATLVRLGRVLFGQRLA